MRLFSFIIICYLLPVEIITQSINELIFYQIDTWDSEEQRWKPSRRDITQYNNADELRSYQSYIIPYDSTEWFLNLDFQYFYKQDYKERTRLESNIDGTYSFTTSRYDYDTGDVFFREETRLSKNQDEEHLERFTTEYEYNGSYVQQVEYFNPENQSWTHSYTNTFTVQLDSNECKSEETLVFNGTPFSKTIIQNDADCNPITRTRYNWNDNDQRWIYQSLDSFIYTSEYIREVHFNWDQHLNGWFNSYIITKGINEPSWEEQVYYSRDGRESMYRQERDLNFKVVYANAKYRSSSTEEWILEYEESNEYTDDGKLIQSNRNEIYIDSLDIWERALIINNSYNQKGYIRESEIILELLQDDMSVEQQRTLWNNEYTYYCNDLRKKRIEYLDSENFWRYNYGYKKPPNCNNVVVSETSVYPNPTSGFILIDTHEFEDNDLTIQLSDTRGQILISETSQNNNVFHHMDISTLNPGIYFISAISNNSNQIRSTRIIKF